MTEKKSPLENYLDVNAAAVKAYKAYCKEKDPEEKKTKKERLFALNEASEMAARDYFESVRGHVDAEEAFEYGKKLEGKKHGKS